MPRRTEAGATETGSTSRPSPKPPSPPARRRGVAAAVTAGLVVLIVSIAAVSALGLGAFFTFRTALRDLSELRVPRIVTGSRLADATNQLIFEVERLVGSDSEASRRIASTNARSQLADIASLLETESLSGYSQAEAFKALESSLEELDSLIAARIKVTQRNEDFHETLLAYPEAALRLLGGSGGAAVPATEAKWLGQVAGIISLAGSATGETSPIRIGQAEQSLAKSLAGLKSISASLGSPSGERIRAFELRLEGDLLGPDGLIALLEQRAEISRQAAGKSNFVRNLAGDFRSTSAIMLNELVTAAADNANALRRQVNRTLAAFIAALLVAASAFLAVTLYFRRNLITRLVNLNDAILKRVAGAEVSIAATGNDEIADMTRSFLYYEDEVVKREMALKELATTDPLTGISNRRHFLESAGAELMKAERFNRPAALLMLDIDLFKSINDTHGHPVGDEVIKSVVAACRGRIRKVDLFGRIGGEEFAVLMPETERDAAIEVAQRIREEVANAVCCVGDLRLACTVSIGVAAAGDFGYDMVELMKASDVALYLAKNSGRNLVRANP